MKKYSVEWKESQTEKYGGWAQDHNNDKWGRHWKWHYIQYGTEYSAGEYFTKKECQSENKRKF